MRVAEKATGTHAVDPRLDFKMLTQTELGSNHIVSTPFKPIANALFQLKSQTPPVRSTSDLIVHCNYLFTKRESTRHREPSLNIWADRTLEKGTCVFNSVAKSVPDNLVRSSFWLQMWPEEDTSQVELPFFLGFSNVGATATSSEPIFGHIASN